MLFCVLIFSLTVTLDIILLGNTGVGKSSAANEIMSFKNGTSNFVESVGCQSYTYDTHSESVGDLRVTDTPGMQDSKGENFDTENIKNVVNYAKQLGYLNAFVIVLPENPRLDAATLKGIKLYVDSFGNETLSRIAFLFNKVLDAEKKELDERADEVRNVVNTHFDSHYDFRFWHINYRPEKRKHISEEGKDEIRRDTREQIGEMLSWASRLKPYSTKYAVFGEYEHARLLREAEEESQRQTLLREESDRKRKDEEERHAFETSVIAEWLEYRTVNVSTDRTPVYTVQQHSNCRSNYFLIFEVGEDCNHWTESVLMGTTVVIIKQNEKRKVIKYGSQEIRNLEWEADGNKFEEKFFEAKTS